MFALGKSALVFCWFLTWVNSQCQDNLLAQVKRMKGPVSICSVISLKWPYMKCTILSSHSFGTGNL